MEVILKEQPAKRLVDTEKITLGFFYMLVYKDFVLRELLTSAMRFDPTEKGQLTDEFNQIKCVFKERVEDQYQAFIKQDFT